MSYALIYSSPTQRSIMSRELEALLEDESKPIFVYDDGQVLGHAFCMITEVKDDKLLQNIKTLYIDDICVDEEARGRHVGKALYEYVRDYAKSIGCNNITLNVWEVNDPALNFYRNMGMKVQRTQFLQEHGHESAKDNDGNNTVTFV